MSGNSRFYSIFLHGMLVALAICSLLLVRQNRLLSDRFIVERPLSAFQIGEPLTPFEVQAADNSSRLLAFADSDRPRLLFFFNTSCSACRENQDRWRELYHALEPSTEVIGVSLDDPLPTRAYVDRLELPFPTVTAAAPEALGQTLGLTRIPETVLVDTRGKVADAFLGVLTDDALERLGLDS